MNPLSAPGGMAGSMAGASDQLNLAQHLERFRQQPPAAPDLRQTGDQLRLEAPAARLETRAQGRSIPGLGERLDRFV